MLTPAQIIELTARRVQRGTAESLFINTINVNDLITIDFVFFPGADNVLNSLIDVLIPVTAAAPSPREFSFKWSRSGFADITRILSSGRISLPLAPGSSGVLTVFSTQWRVTRAAAGVTLSAIGTVRGIQERLNILGYHLRAPGAVAAGNDNVNGARTERAVLAFQVDYRKPAGAPAAAPSGPLPVRGEPFANLNIQGIIDSLNRTAAGLSVNPSIADAPITQAALVAIVGA